MPAIAPPERLDFVDFDEDDDDLDFTVGDSDGTGVGRREGLAVG
jgi:hypothetical protein